jgi:hypothetical protein
LEGSRNNSFSAGVWGLAADFSSKRGTMRPDIFQAYQLNKLKNEKYSMRAGMLDKESQGLDIQQKQLQAKTWNWNMTDVDQFESSLAAQMVKDKKAKERGPISFADRMKAEEKRYEIEEGKAKIMEKSADLEAQMLTGNEALLAQILDRGKLDLSKVEADYAQAMMAVTARINEIREEIYDGKGGSGGDSPSEVNPNTIVNISDIKSGFTEADIDRWLPQIREKLCAMARRDGSR